MSASRIRRVALYARLSVTTEESVSIQRQLESGRRYAEARGWKVVLEAIDDGVSASKVRPEERPGWRSLLDAPQRYEAVIVWRVDRLARRVLDFLKADEALQARGAAIVAVEDPVDMTTAQGRAFAQVLAVFAELEAASIAARVKAARRALLEAGRRGGGRPPLGFRNVPNPEGPGYVLAHDPEWIDVVREMVRRAQAGDSLYSIGRWLESQGIAPRARAGRKTDTWHDASIEAVLRAPALAGMTPFRGDVLRDADGLPVVDESIAILTLAERRDLLAKLDAAKKPGTRQKAGSEPHLLFGLARCATCGGPLYRATGASGKYRLLRCQSKTCPKRAGTGREALEAHVEETFLAEVGDLPVVRVEEVAGADPAPTLSDIEAAIAETLAALADDDADVPSLTERLANLKAARARARAEAEAAGPEVRTIRTGETFAEAWQRTDEVEERRQLLLSALEAVIVAPGTGGRGFRPERVTLEWRT